ncbi:MAG: hypothetical protein HOG05_08435, partial [Bacteroidetes bacterium]|nr:hypothetical protein [Bacteroidota bacterium]
WKATQRQDSVFLVNIPQGQDTFDFAFYVRSVDNEGMVDPSPAYIVFPVKNSPPSVKFEYAVGNPKRKPDNSFPILKYTWKGSDPDGDENIAFYELFLNDTSSNPVVIDAVFNSVILKAKSSNAITDCEVLQGNNLTLHTNTLEGMLLNDTNELIIRAVDIVGEKSAFTYSYKIYVRKPKSDVLLVNAYSSSIVTRENFYVNNLQSIGITDFDVTRLQEINSEHYTELAPDNITQSMIFNLFETIIWFGKDIDFSMSLAQRTTSEFFAKGGKMFMSVEIASSISEQAGYLDFSPMDSLVGLPPGVIAFRLPKGSDVNKLHTGWPDLKTDPNKFIASARPFYEDFSSTPLYDAVITKSTSSGSTIWTGKSTVMAKRANTLGKTTFIISSLELHNLDGNGNISELFTKLFIDEFEL